jgi:hypothetical protein
MLNGRGSGDKWPANFLLNQPHRTVHRLLDLDLLLRLLGDLLVRAASPA